MGSGFDDRIYWYFFTITVIYNSSHIELLLNDVCPTNLHEESRTDLNLSNSRINSLLYLPRGRNISHHIEQLMVLCYFVCHGNVFIAAETGVCVALRSTLSSASVAVPAFSPCLPSRYLAMDYPVTILIQESYLLWASRGNHS
jgi:hypothetical protein